MSVSGTGIDSGADIPGSDIPAPTSLSKPNT